MYAQATIAGLQVPVMNPAQMQQNFMFAAQTPDQELNQLTPQVAMAAANIIVQSLAQQHPLRVNAMNILGQNGFVNNEFRSFINQVMRMSLALFEARQINSIQQVIQHKLPEYVQLMSAVLAVQNPAVVQLLDQNTFAQIQQMAQGWFTSVQQAEQIIAQAAQRGGMMQQTQQGYGYGNQMQQPGNLNAYGTTFGQTGSMTSGAFVNAGQATQQNQSATAIAQVRPSRFQEKLQAEQQALLAGRDNERGVSVMQGQQAAAPTTPPPAMATPSSAGTSYQERLQRELNAAAGVVGTMPSGAAQSIIERQSKMVQQAATTAGYGQTAEGNIDWSAGPTAGNAPAHTSTVYERAILDPELPQSTVAVQMPNPVELIEKKPVLREFELNGHKFRMTALLVSVKDKEIGYKEAGWKPSKYQSHFPAWCRRTHEITYAVGEDGDVVAITLELSKEKKEEMFEYEAHSIDPTKGLPANPIVEPVSDEAKKVLYTEDKDPQVKVVVKKEYLNATSTEDLIEQVMTDAAVALEEDKTAAFYASTGLIHSIVTSRNEEVNTRSYDQVREVFLQVTLDKSAEAIKAIEVPTLRRRIDGIFTDALNDMLQLQLGLDAGITSFSEEAGTIVDDVREAFGDLYADSLGEAQSKLIASVIDACLPDEVIGHHESMISAQEETLNKINKTAFYLVSIVSVMVTRFTDDELALGLAPVGASQLQQDSYSLLYAAIREYFESENGKNERVKVLILSTIDGVKYKVSVNPLNPAMFLIKAAD